MVIGCSRSQLERRYSGFAIRLMRWQAAEKPANRACIIFAHGRESDRILGFLLEMAAWPLFWRVFDGSMHSFLIDASHRVDVTVLLWTFLLIHFSLACAVAMTADSLLSKSLLLLLVLSDGLAWPSILVQHCALRMRLKSCLRLDIVNDLPALAQHDSIRRKSDWSEFALVGLLFQSRSSRFAA